MSIRKNTTINILGAIVPMVLMLITVPVYLKLLGEARYGVLALVWLILGYFSFMEMGLGKATANQLAKAYDATAHERSEIFWTALIVNATMGVIAAGILWLVGDYIINYMLKISDDFRAEALTALPWLIATFPLALTSSVLNGALEGRDQFLLLNILQISSNVSFQVVPLLAAWLVGPSLAVVIPAAVLTRVLMNIWFLRACQRTVPLVGRPMPKRSRVHTLFTYGGWVAITGAIGPLLDTAERFIIGIVAGAVAVTHYTVPMQFVGKIKIIPGALSRAMFPIFSSSKIIDGTALAQRTLPLLSIVMTLLVLVVTLLLRPFLELWLGIDFAVIAAPIGEILLIGVWFNSIAHIPYFLIQAQGRPDLVAKVHLVELPFYLVATWFTLEWVGLEGVAIVWVLRCLTEALVLLELSNLFKVLAHWVIPQAIIIGLIVYGMQSFTYIETDYRVLGAAFLMIIVIMFLLKVIKVRL